MGAAKMPLVVDVVGYIKQFKAQLSAKEGIMKTKNITIVGRRWFDKVNGNTYCSSRIYINNDLVHTIGMTYGYGDYYEQASIEWLKNNGHIKNNLSRYEIREKYNLVSEVTDGLKRDLFKAQ